MTVLSNKNFGGKFKSYPLPGNSSNFVLVFDCRSSTLIGWYTYFAFVYIHQSLREIVNYCVHVFAVMTSVKIKKSRCFVPYLFSCDKRRRFAS